jgi:hypothetical protein
MDQVLPLSNWRRIPQDNRFIGQGFSTQWNRNVKNIPLSLERLESPRFLAG